MSSSTMAMTHSKAVRKRLNSTFPACADGGGGQARLVMSDL
jgi:hypothetical protein